MKGGMRNITAFIGVLAAAIGFSSRRTKTSVAEIKKEETFKENARRKGRLNQRQQRKRARQNPNSAKYHQK